MAPDRGSFFSGRGLVLMMGSTWWFYIALYYSWSSHSFSFPVWQGGTYGQIWCRSSIPEYSSASFGPISFGYAMVGSLFCWFGSPLWAPVSALYFQFSRRPGGVNSNGIPYLSHYLDDFITAGPPDSPQCVHNLNTALAVCGRLGFPLHPDKYVGPAPVLTILGIELHSINQVARLPADKTLGLTRIDCLLATLEMVQLTGAQVTYWPLASCSKSSLAWQDLSASHDWPFVLFSEKGSSYPP